MDELLELHDSLRAARERKQKQRLRTEKATLAGLLARSRDQGLGDLLSTAHESFYCGFEAVAPIGNSLAFRAKIEDKDVTIIRLRIDRSSESKGLFFEIDLKRLRAHFGDVSPTESKLRTLFPIEEGPSRSSGQWSTGYFLTEADIRTAGSAICKISNDKFERPMRNEVLYQASQPANISGGQGRYGGIDDPFGMT